MRETYLRGGLLEGDCDSNPIVQFQRWFQQAKDADLKEPNAMTLATVGADGRPSARIVLLKEVSDFGFVFHSNYRSRKARDCETNSAVSLVFYWAELERQVRVEGSVSRISRAESEAYFAGRPRGSQLGAWVSQQSEIATSRLEIEAKLKEVEMTMKEAPFVPTPDFWGGYRVLQESVEFWQGRPNRLHDRLVYRRCDDGWKLERLWP